MLIEFYVRKDSNIDWMKDKNAPFFMTKDLNAAQFFFVFGKFFSREKHSNANKKYFKNHDLSKKKWK